MTGVYWWDPCIAYIAAPWILWVLMVDVLTVITLQYTIVFLPWWWSNCLSFLQAFEMFNHPLSTHQSQIGKHGLQQDPDKTATSKPRQKHQHLVNLAQKLARGECADPSPICCGLYLWYSELTKEHTELVDYRNLQIFGHVRCNPYFNQCSTGNNMCMQYTAENLIYPPVFLKQILNCLGLTAPGDNTESLLSECCPIWRWFAYLKGKALLLVSVSGVTLKSVSA